MKYLNFSIDFKAMLYLLSLKNLRVISDQELLGLFRTDREKLGIRIRVCSHFHVHSKVVNYLQDKV